MNICTEKDESFGVNFKEIWNDFQERFLPIILSEEKSLTVEEAEELWRLYFIELLPMIVGFPPAYLKHITSQCFIALCRHLVRVGKGHIYLNDTYRHFRSKDVFDLSVVLKELEVLVAACYKKHTTDQIDLEDVAISIELLYPQRFPGEKNYDIARMFAKKHGISYRES